MPVYDIAYLSRGPRDDWRLILVVEPIDPPQSVYLQHRTDPTRGMAGWRTVALLAESEGYESSRFGIGPWEGLGRFSRDRDMAKQKLREAVEAHLAGDMSR